MNIEHLGYVLEINHYKSINRASKKLFISQPSLSTVLKSIEAEIGYAVFERTNAGVQPTEKGKTFLAAAQRMFDEYNNLKQAPEVLPEEENLSLSFSFSSLFSRAYFEFKKAHPPKTATQDLVREVTIAQNLQDVINHTCRLAVVYTGQQDIKRYEMYAKSQGLVLRPLKYHIPMQAVVAPDHPLVQAGSVTLETFRQYPIVTYSDLDYGDILGVLGIERDHDILYVSSRSTYYDAVRYGGYISVSMAFSPQEAEKNGCLCLPVQPDTAYTVVAYVMEKNHRCSPREKLFLEFLDAYVAQYHRE